MKDAEKLYTKETSRSHVKKVITKMADDHYRDFYVFKIVFEAIKKKSNLVVYPLPWDMTERQINM
jgi:hypothetical protein